MASVDRASMSLARSLTSRHVTAMLVTSVIGAGVFIKARAMTCNVGSPDMVLLAYVTAGLFTLAGALTFAELSAMMPRAGGQYNYIGAAFGPRWAFLYGWMETLIDGAASVAAVSMVMVIFLNDVLAGRLSTQQVQWVTVVIIAIVTALNLASAQANGRLATLVSVLKVLFVLGIGVSAFVFSGGSLEHFAHSGANGICENIPASARLGLTGFGAAVIGALWSYNGWQVLCAMTEEVRDPGRTMPRSLVSGVVIVALLYLFITASYFFALDPVQVASVPESASVAGAVMASILGPSVASILSLGLMLSVFGCLHMIAMAASRIPFAMARDGLLPATLAEVSSRTRAPSHAVLLLGMLAAAFAFTGTFDILTDMVVFMLLFFNGLAVASVYVLRRKLPLAERPYRVWGYPVMPAVYLVAAGCLMINTLLATPVRSLVGIGIVSLGLPVYAYYARKNSAKGPQNWLEQPL